MGRSVSSLCNADYVFYFDCSWMNENDEDGEYDEYISQLNWDDFVSNFKGEIMGKLKSFNECDKWEHREDHIILENELAEISIAEYCGFVSISVRAKDDEFYCSDTNIKEGLAKYHVKQIEKTIEKCLLNCGVELLNRLGTMSNGVSVYESTK